MKHNLKNFPVKGTPQAYERWGKGFKKELQELKKEYNIPYAQYVAISNFIKEILGE